MKWDDSYTVGIDRIDSQHKQLIKLIADYSESITREESNNINESTLEILNFLINYTDFHFRTEEGFMAKINYPNLLEHKIHHKELITNVKELVIKLRDKQTIAPIDFYEFLRKWLKNHILIEDQKIGKYYAKISLSSNFKAIDISHEYKLLEQIVESLDSINMDSCNVEDQSSDNELLRIIYLDDYFSRIKIVRLEDLKLTLNLLKDLYVQGIITPQEKEKIYISLLPQKKFRKLKQNNNNNTSIDSCLKLIDWIAVN